MTTLKRSVDTERKDTAKRSVPLKGARKRVAATVGTVKQQLARAVPEPSARDIATVAEVQALYAAFIGAVATKLDTADFRVTLEPFRHRTKGQVILVSVRSARTMLTASSVELWRAEYELGRFLRLLSWLSARSFYRLLPEQRADYDQSFDVPQKVTIYLPDEKAVARMQAKLAQAKTRAKGLSADFRNVADAANYGTRADIVRQRLDVDKRYQRMLARAEKLSAAGDPNAAKVARAVREYRAQKLAEAGAGK